MNKSEIQEIKVLFGHKAKLVLYAKNDFVEHFKIMIKSDEKFDIVSDNGKFITINPEFVQLVVYTPVQILPANKKVDKVLIHNISS